MRAAHNEKDEWKIVSRNGENSKKLRMKVGGAE